MNTDRRLAGQSDAVQRHALLEIIRASPTLIRALRAARQLDFPDWWIVSGAIYNLVFNRLTGRPEMYGVKDIDLFYFSSDTSEAAERVSISRAAAVFAPPPAPPVEVRNQARVHLWYESHFGRPYAPLRSSREAVDRFASKTHSLAVRLEEDDQLTLYAPYGLDDLFALRITPNPLLDNRPTHDEKAARALACWPELTIVPWPEEPG